MRSGYRFFIAGIIQGSKYGPEIHSQGYRDLIKKILDKAFPDSEVYCPVQNHPDSISYDDTKAREVFLKHLDIVKKAHCLVAYLPEASMGTSIEMWEAYNQKTVTVTITPMTWNWVIRILSDRIYSDIDSFRSFAESGEMERFLRRRFSIDV